MIQTSKLTELIDISTLSTTINGEGVIVENYIPFKQIYGSILSDSGSDNNQNASTTFNNQTVYNDRVRFYIRYLPITLNNKLKKQFKITWNSNEYYITSLKHVANRSASIIECSSSI